MCEARGHTIKISSNAVPQEHAFRSLDDNLVADRVGIAPLLNPPPQLTYVPSGWWPRHSPGLAILPAVAIKSRGGPLIKSQPVPTPDDPHNKDESRASSVLYVIRLDGNRRCDHGGRAEESSLRSRVVCTTGSPSSPPNDTMRKPRHSFASFYTLKPGSDVFATILFLGEKYKVSHPHASDEQIDYCMVHKSPINSYISALILALLGSIRQSHVRPIFQVSQTK
jgi:hypothetical protein